MRAVHLLDRAHDRRRDGLVIQFVPEQEIGPGLLECLGIFSDPRLDGCQQRREIRRQISLLKPRYLLLRFSGIGLEGRDTLGVAGRQHSPVRDPYQKDLGLKGAYFVGEVRFIRGVDKFLDVGRHLVAVREQQVTACQHLFDRLAKSGTLRRHLGHFLDGIRVHRAPFLGRRCPGSLLKKVGYLG